MPPLMVGVSLQLSLQPKNIGTYQELLWKMLKRIPLRMEILG